MRLSALSYPGTVLRSGSHRSLSRGPHVRVQSRAAVPAPSSRQDSPPLVIRHGASGVLLLALAGGRYVSRGLPRHACPARPVRRRGGRQIPPPLRRRHLRTHPCARAADASPQRPPASTHASSAARSGLPNRSHRRWPRHAWAKITAPATGGTPTVLTSRRAAS